MKDILITKMIIQMRKFILLTVYFFFICGNLQGQKSHWIAPRTDKDVTTIRGTVVLVIFNRSTKSVRKDPEASIYQDVYQNGVLYIRAGTPVSFFVTSRKCTPKTLEFKGFETTSVEGYSVRLNGEFVFYGNYNYELIRWGQILTGLTVGFALPITIPMFACANPKAKVKKGTIFYLDLE